MEPNGAPGLTVVRRMVFEPGSRPCLKLVVPADQIAHLTAEDVVEDLRTALTLCSLPDTAPRTTPMNLIGTPRPRRSCTLQIVDGDPGEHGPDTYLDAYPDHRRTLNSADPGQLRGFHKHVVATLSAMGHSTEPERSAEA